MNKLAILSLTALIALPLSACSSAKEQLGLNKQVPDEFQVVKRAPLELPPQYTLRPPQPGAPRPQEQETVEQAAQAVFGETPVEATPTSGEGALFQAAGAFQVDPSIRAKVDSESANLQRENEPVIDKLLSIGSDRPPPASVVDAQKEAERLQQNKAEGKPATAGETPSVEN